MPRKNGKGLVPVESYHCVIPVKSYQRVVDVLQEEFPEDLVKAGILCLQLYTRLNQMATEPEPLSRAKIAEGAYMAIMSMDAWVRDGSVKLEEPQHGRTDVANRKRRRQPAADRITRRQPGQP